MGTASATTIASAESIKAYVDAQDHDASDESVGGDLSGTVANATIVNDAVTYAKMQDVSATDRILGRDSAGSGIVEEISPSSLRTMINVEDGATADQTDAEIRTAVENATDSNVFTDADHSKLDGIESGATADQTGAEIKTAYEGEADTNAFTDADHSKLDGIEASADVTDATNVASAGAVMESDTTTASMSFVVDEDDMSSNSATKLATQQSIKAYVDSVAQGLNVKTACAVATTANITLSGEQTIDGVTTSTSRVLVKDQTDASENGIYVSASGAWARATDLDAPQEVASSFVFITSGTNNADTGWVCTNEPESVTVGTDDITFSQFSDAGHITSGTGLTKTGNTLSVDASQTQITAVGTIGTGVWQGTAIASAYLDADTAHLSGSQTFSGAKTFSTDVNVTADGARLFISSNDYELFSIGRAGSSGASLDQAYLRMKNAGTNTIALHTAGDSYFNGGSVGIGISSSILGDVHIKKDAPFLMLEATAGGASPSDLKIQQDYRTSIFGTSAGDGQFVFKNNVSSAGEPKDSGDVLMVIQDDSKVGIGTASPDRQLTLSGASAFLMFEETGVTADNKKWEMLVDGETWEFQAINDALSSASTIMKVNRTGTTIDEVLFPSGNVGIGDTSPQCLLDIGGATHDYGALSVNATGSKSIALFQTEDTQTFTGTSLAGSSHSDCCIIIRNNSDTDNNFSQINFMDAGAFTNAVIMGRNVDHDTSGGGDLLFFTRADNSNVDTTTLRMIIKDDGNVGIGQPSPSTKLSITAGSANGIELDQDSDLASDSARLFFSSSSGGYSIFNTGGDLRFSSGATAGSSSGSERMRITSSGDIRTNVTGGQIHLYDQNNTGDFGGRIYYDRTNTKLQIEANEFAGDDVVIKANDQVQLHDASGVRVTMDAGNVLVGKTVANNDDVGVWIHPDGASWFTQDGDYGIGVNRKTSYGTLVQFTKDQAGVGEIYTRTTGALAIGAGDVALECNDSNDAVLPSTTTTENTRDNAISLGIASVRFDDAYITNGVTTGSDRNEKKNIEDSDLGLGFVNRLRPVSYKWIENKSDRTHYGLISQEVESLISDLDKENQDFAGITKTDISEGQDGSDYRYGLRYNEFISPMIKAIQELSAENNSLKERIEALENA